MARIGRGRTTKQCQKMHSAHIPGSQPEKNGRTKSDVDEIIRWLTGYSQKELEALLSMGRMTASDAKLPCALQDRLLV